MAKDNREEFEMFEEEQFENKEDDGIVEYNKYMVLLNKGTIYEEICGVYDVEIDALRRLREEKVKKSGNTSVIMADISYVYLSGVKFVKDYKEIR